MNEEKIEEILKNIGSETVPADVHKIAEQTSKEFSKTLTQTKRHYIFRNNIMKSSIIKLAAAAVIIITILIGINRFGGPIEGVAWAEVVEKVEQTQSLSCRVWSSMTSGSNEQPVEAEIIVYDSSEYGSRMDTYIDDKLISTTYMPAGKNEAIMVIPQAKKYSRMLFTKEQLKHMREKQKDPREFIKLFLSVEHTGLGRKKINGIQAEGIEVDSPKTGGGLFESAIGRLWVDVETDLPVKMEIEGISGGGSIQQKIVMDEFKWDKELDASLFEPNIPADYTLMADMELPDTNEETAIQGLRNFAELTDGRYPSSLAMMSAMKELQEIWEQKYEKPPTNQELQKFLSLNAACQFYAQLLQEDKDVEYYGDKVTAEDINEVLMRWKVSDSKHRVIYGGLRTETVEDKEEKSSKEKTLDMALKISGKKLSANERGSIMRMLTLNEKDLIKGLSAFLELSGGRYPSDLDPNTTIVECDSLLKAKYDRGEINRKQAEKYGRDVFFAGVYYKKLVRLKKEPAYYGHSVTVEDAGAVLMRWKVSEDNYRVIFGDLSNADVSAEELAELENPPSQ